MRVGIHTFSFNMSEESPIQPLLCALEERGHEVVFLDTDKAQQDGDQIVFPELPAGGEIDTFISYLPSSDPVKLWEGIEPDEVPYFKQVEWLSSKFPSPTSYNAQMITNSKTQMGSMFDTIGLPIPRSYDGSDRLSQDKILSEIKSGKTMVFKPSFGGSGEGIIKVNTVEEAERAFKEFGEMDSQSFLVQDYIDVSNTNGRATDYRAVVVGDQVVGGFKRTTQPGEWRGNNALGSENEPFQFTLQQEEDAVKALGGSGLGFGSVDILIDKKTGQHYICEINDGLSMTLLDKVRPDLDLSDLIVRMVEKKYGECNKPGLCGQFSMEKDEPTKVPVKEAGMTGSVHVLKQEI